MCPLDAQGVEALEEDLLPPRRELAEIASGLQALLERAVVDVAEVHGVLDLVAAAFEIAPQHVGEPGEGGLHFFEVENPVHHGAASIALEARHDPLPGILRGLR